MDLKEVSEELERAKLEGPDARTIDALAGALDGYADVCIETAALRIALKGCLTGIDLIATRLEKEGLPCKSYKIAAANARQVLGLDPPPQNPS